MIGAVPERETPEAAEGRFTGEERVPELRITVHPDWGAHISQHWNIINHKNKTSEENGEHETPQNLTLW